MCKNDNSKEEEEILTLKQVSREFRIGTGKLRKWAKSGVFRPIRLVGIHPLKYTREAVEAFLQANTVNQSGGKHEPF